MLAGIESTNHPELTRPVVRAQAANAYTAGAGGVLFHTYYPDPGRYPYDDEASGRLRFMGHPDLLEKFDKTFRLGIPANAQRAPSWGLTEQLPAELQPGEPARSFTLEIADDVPAGAAIDRLWRCELRLMLQHLTYQDRIELQWNDVPIDASAWRLADWTYQLRPRPDYAINGYRLHIDLKKLGQLPQKGRNTVAIAVLEKDAQLVHPITLAEIERVVEYLPHRNALRPDENYRD